MVSSDRLVGASTTVPRPPAAYSGITAGTTHTIAQGRPMCLPADMQERQSNKRVARMWTCTIEVLVTQWTR